MPGGKIPMRLIQSPQKRAATFAMRKKSLMKMAGEISTLCDAKVAVGGGGEGGAVSTEVWESEEGVLDKYRALPPEVRAKRSHTHQEYLEEELRKERAKLARVRKDGALKPWDAALNGITEEETRALRKSITDKIEAARARLEAMGQPDHDNGVNDVGGLDLQQHVPPSASDAIESVPVGHYIGSSGGGGGDGNNQMQTTPAADGISFAEQYVPHPWEWDGTFPFQPQAVQPEHSFQYNADHYAPMDGYPLQDPGNGLPDLAAGCIDMPFPCNAAAAAAAAATTVPARYPPTLDTGHGSFLAAPAQPLAFSTAGADFINAPNNFLTTGVSDYSAQSSGYGIGNQIDNAKHLLYQMQMQYPFGGTGGAEPSNTQSQNLGSFSNVGDYSAAQSSADGIGNQIGDANRLNQMHYPSGRGTGGADPSDKQSKNRGS